MSCDIFYPSRRFANLGDHGSKVIQSIFTGDRLLMNFNDVQMN